MSRKVEAQEVTDKLRSRAHELRLDVSTYKNLKTKARFVDVEHGEWWAAPKVVLRGYSHPARKISKMRATREKKHGPLQTKEERKLAGNLRDRINSAFRRARLGKKPRGTNALLGGNVRDVMRHIESKFQPGMSWSNHGQWHPTEKRWNIDHIYPLSKARNKSHMAELCHYTNLQPLWASENNHKRAKI